MTREQIINEIHKAVLKVTGKEDADGYIENIKDLADAILALHNSAVAEKDKSIQSLRLLLEGYEKSHATQNARISELEKIVADYMTLNELAEKELAEVRQTLQDRDKYIQQELKG